MTYQRITQRTRVYDPGRSLTDAEQKALERQLSAIPEVAHTHIRPEEVGVVLHGELELRAWSTIEAVIADVEGK